MNKLVLLTGATGFVGSQILKALLENGCRVRIIAREEIPSFHDRDGIESIKITEDLFSANDEWLFESLQDVHTVIHAAWYVEPGNYLQSQLNVVCLEGTLNLAKMAIQAGVSKFVGIGTCFEYDVESGVLEVDTPLRPIALYGATKAAVFEVLSHWLPPNGIEFAWCRLFYLYGEGEDSRRLIAYIHKKLSKGELAELTSGNQVRDFMDVQEAGKKIVEAALGNFSGPLNICSGKAITVKELAEQIADIYGRHDLLGFGKRADNLQDPRKIVGVPSI